MAITNSFKNAVVNENVTGIRIMMKDSLLVDPTFKEFDEMRKLSSDVKGLYDPHDGGTQISNSSAWDDKYMDDLMYQIVNNFSKERLDHLKAVVRKLHPPVASVYTRTENDASPLPHLNRSGKILVGVAAGAAVGATVSIATSATVVAGIVIGAVVGGAAVGIATNGGK